MGLDIDGWYSDKRYSYVYGGLHRIRFLAIKVAGFEGTAKDFSDKYLSPFKSERSKVPIWEKYPKFYQLLHFSDAQGIMLPGWYLEDIVYKNSFSLGNLTKLVEELEIIKDAIAREPEKYTWERATKPFWDLYDLAKEELELGGVLKFW